MKKCDCSCKCKLTDSIKESSAAIWLLAACGFLLGIIIGFVFSPIKKGVNIGNGNKSYKNENCSVIYNDTEDELDYENDDEIKF